MTRFGDKRAPIYIKGVKCMATIGKVWENSFCADTDDLPMVAIAAATGCRPTAPATWRTVAPSEHQETLIL